MPWRVGTVVAGHVRADRLPVLLGPGSPFRRDVDGIALPGADAAQRTSAVAAFVGRLAGAGHFALRRELYPVAPAFGDDPLLLVDRGAATWLGIRPRGVHVNGWCRLGGVLHAWVALRSFAQTYPGQWDNTVAGGQPHGLTLLENVVKECAEEAGIPESVARAAVPCGTITYVREEPVGLKPDTIFVFDLELPAGFAPRPVDGEVERFVRLPAREIADVVRQSARCKPNCSLVWIDFLLRHGVLDEVAADERAVLARALRVPLP